MSWHETPQQAIEGYLEALLREDPSDDDQVIDDYLEPSSPRREESLQARQLSDSMVRARQAAAEPARPVMAEVVTTPQVILPDLKLPDPLPEPVITEPEPVVAPIIAEPEPIAAEVLAEPVVAESKPEIQAAQPVVTPDTPQVPDQPPSPPGWKNGRPVWAQERFECLLFKVKGLTLAVPLVELGGIIKIEKEPTPLFGQPDWFIGMLRSNNMNVCMVDTAQWVLPPALITSNPEPYKLIIRIHNSAWGLSCNAVDRSISLQPDQVRWRTSLGKRPWLAGTVIDHMCALIDVAAFDRLLREGHGQMEPANLSALKDLDD
ncbi:MAG: chemotaxis protein CheW [Marinospirillum sp.]|uniref:chemotaxis protein CheW n=1 Tax=Marinospirillum sp. TaxID=2183934 RepID=UPI001A036815|nr:chemotaxis protein CheW [Marinospirillum sp.]MBE0505289.1 chemotaxis protein CheW [Marinospirillum sp.]